MSADFHVDMDEIPFTSSPVLYAATEPVNVLGEPPSHPKNPDSRPNKSTAKAADLRFISQSWVGLEMRSRRSQPPAVPDVRTLASRRENGGDLSRNRARFKLIATLNIKVAASPTATTLFPALIAPGYDPTQAGLSCRVQRKRAIVGTNRERPRMFG
ncbi:Uncharacterised protein [Cedecea neteri]|uniref:Uncharacterized protein n=1 Tax=Cedecea neteri TaxID=158822 RepID=A0A2X3KVS0_9ENTR|nr:Uncharacterised protein [Cedecea neteri]